MAEHKQESGRDLKPGIEFAELAENTPLLGHVDGKQMILVRQGENVFAVGSACSHYGGPLGEGLVVDKTIRCPWHHARFDLRTGEAVGAPALNAIPCFHVEQQSGRVIIGEKKSPDFRIACPSHTSSVVIVGAGAAGAACADMLRAKGYDGPIALTSDEEPVDRPNLSKDYLAGNAPEEWIPLRTREHYESIQVELITRDPAIRISPAEHRVTLTSGRVLSYGSLLLATGAEPRSLQIPGADLPHVLRLRTLADSKAIIGKAAEVHHCVVIGASFIGLEVAASLRQRGLEVAVIGQESVPLARVLGEEVGRFVQNLHEQHGVRFFLNSAPREIRPESVELTDGRSIQGTLVVLGVGVSPRTALAESAGLKVNNGVVVDEALRTSASDVYAAGDVARYPEHASGADARIEHWVVAERQGQAVARSMLGIGGPFRDAPFFWSQHYATTIAYVGHAPSWDTCEVKGDLAGQNAGAIYRRSGRAMAVATIGRDQLSLQIEAALEEGGNASVEAILRTL